MYRKCIGISTEASLCRGHGSPSLSEEFPSSDRVCVCFFLAFLKKKKHICPLQACGLRPTGFMYCSAPSLPLPLLARQKERQLFERNILTAVLVRTGWAKSSQSFFVGLRPPQRGNGVASVLGGCATNRFLPLCLVCLSVLCVLCAARPKNTPDSSHAQAAAASSGEGAHGEVEGLACYFSPARHVFQGKRFVASSSSFHLLCSFLEP